jgi:hypothetical protein
VDEAGFEHRRQVHERVVAALKRGCDFATLLGTLGGADPLVALDALKEIAEEQSTSATAASRLIAEARALPAPPEPSRLPIVHPLDYHWSFSAATVENLLSRIAAESDTGETLLFLGTPTLHIRALERLPDRRCILLDRDGAMITAARSAGGEAYELDLFADPLPEIQASLAVADPPWYPEASIAFASAAAQLLQPGSRFLVGAAAELTRPGVERERAVFRKEMERVGFESLAEETGLLRYDTPPFEQAAMAAAGLPSSPPSWRRGDLLSFALRNPAAPRKILPNERWVAHRIAEIPIYANPDAPSIGDELIGSILEDDVLPSVSRRQRLRRLAALWTSRNRIFVSSDPPHLARILASLAAGKPLSEDGDTAAAIQLRELSVRERREHGLVVAILSAHR